MEGIITNTNVYNKNCIGCKKFNKDVLVTLSTADEPFIDMFLTQEQAIMLRDQLDKTIKQNEEYESEGY